MFGSVSRRDFLKGSAALVAALSVSSWFPLSRRARGQSNPLPSAPGFTTLPATAQQLATGQPIADIAAGWDGTHWAVDALGVAHVYDPLLQRWTPFGKGVGAATVIGNDFYLFRGGEVAVYNIQAGPVLVQPISQLWPGLPSTFTSDLDGAFANGTVIYLCRGGRYVFADLSSAPVAFSQPAPLNTWPGWPANDPWAQGTVAKTATWIDDQIGAAALFFPVETPPTEYTYSYLVQGGSATAQPIAQLSNFIPPLLAPQLANLLTSASFDAYVAHTTTDNVTYMAWVFAGPVIWSQSSSDQGSGPAVAAALAAWVPAWEPMLRQAPRGRVGNLWSVNTAGAVVFHDGEQWNPAPALPGVTVLGVDVGADGVPFLLASGAGGAALYPFDAAAQSWQAPLSLSGIDAQQVAVGDQTRVFVRDSSGNGYKYAAGSFAQVLTGVAHLTANHDGTVWHSDGSATAFRFISERTYPSQALPVASAVQKVASTAYGNAMLLTNQGGAQQLYRYDSPYVFKTSPPFVPVANGPVIQNPQVKAGGGYCFINLGGGVVALDSHTGAEIWSRTLPNGEQCAAIVYDPVRHLLYAVDGGQSLFALDAATGAERWSFQVGVAPISQPLLKGGSLCLLGGGVVYWLDTAAALAQAGGGQPVTPTWQTTLDATTQFSVSVALVTHNKIYAFLTETGANPSQQYWALKLDGSSPTPLFGTWPPAIVEYFYAPLTAQVTWEGQPVDMLYVNRQGVISAVGLNLVQAGSTFVMPDYGASFLPGLARSGELLYVCGSDFRLYQLDLSQPFELQSLQPVNFTLPITIGAIGAGPITATCAAGDLIAFSCATPDQAQNYLCLYDPTTGNVLLLETDHLLATQLSVDGNGILYAAGWDPLNPNAPFGQVYAIRIDTLLQQERAFIVESELMQDFDEPAAGQLTATARYQTHVTIVDPNKAPQPFQAVKVWAETGDPNLLALVLIDGATYYVNELTPAAVQTDAAGTVTIVSDATDLSTPSLKLWAGFMDPYERIVVYPDRAFHNRLTTTHYDNSSTNPDPTRINLATATTYDVTNLTSPPTLFAASEQPQASAAAGAVQQMANAIGYQQGVTPGAARDRHAVAAASNNYLAYGDLAGAAYGPVNTPANRLVTALATPGFTGFAYDGVSFTVTPLSVADAANAIDALAGQTAAAPGSFWSRLRALWEKIKGGVAEVAKVVVSIGKDIYLGLQYIENGVVQVLRQALRDIEDVAIAIGSVFVQLGKDIVKAAEALSVLFHLGEVVNTYHLITGFLGQTNLVSTVQAARSDIYSYLGGVENEIADAFSQIIGALEGDSSTARATATISGLNGMGNSPRTIFTVGPKNTTPTNSQAVPAMWGIHKLRQNYPNATAPSGRAGAAQPQADALATFLTSFFSDPTNTSQLSQAHQNIHAQLKFGSAKEFFASLLATLLQGLEDVALAAVGLVQSLVDGVVGAITADVISGLETIQIPVLSALWKALTGNPLTFLDVLLFVAAIPVTLVYRITEGAYPQAQFAAGVTASATTVLNRVAGLMASIFGLVNGAFSAISDALVIADVTLDGGPKWLMGILGTAAAVGLTIAAGLSIGLAKESWVTFASALGIASLVMNLSYVPLPAEVPSVVGVILALVLAVIVWQEYVHTEEQEADKLNLSAGVLGLVPAIVNPIKFLPDDTLAPFVSPIADVVFGQAVAWLTLGATLKTWDPGDAPTALPDGEEPTLGAHRVFMPAILQGR